MQEGIDEETLKALEEQKVLKNAIKKATIKNLDGEYDIKRMKQLFYSQFYLYQGLGQLRNHRGYNP
jgi:hypothetical protein